MFENKLTHNGIHYSRYVASWIIAGVSKLTAYRNQDFESWLRESQKLTEEEIQDIHEIYSNGKMELESSARLWIKEHKESEVKNVTTIYKG